MRQCMGLLIINESKTNNVMISKLALYRNKCDTSLQKIPGNIQSVKKKKEHSYLFQYKSTYRNETGTNHHGSLSTII